MRSLHIALVAAALLTACAKKDNPGFQGWVEADLIFVGPDEAGRLEWLKVREGDQVETGTLLFAVDTELQQADLDMAHASLANAKVSFDRALRCYKVRPALRRQSTMRKRSSAPRWPGSTPPRPV